ncbi:MAG: DMT family transporter [Acidobacteriaceae bacterium]|nr:DMT family transporter [Acidobacteriaceae bacterium]
MPGNNALAALAAAVLWGGGDFSGGMGAKHSGNTMGGALRVVLVSHAMSLAVLVSIALARGGAFPRGAPLAWGLGAGLLGGLSLTAFYSALARGAMGASAAVSGLLAAAIPAAVSSIAEGSPGLLRIAGFLIAGAAIWLIAAGDNPENMPVSAGTMWLAVLSGAGFGVYFVALKFASSAGFIWPMATARMASLTVCSITLCSLIAARSPLRAGKLTPIGLLWIAGAGALDTGGNLLYMASTQAGRLDVAAVLASLYPASTILLAAWMLHERPTRRQAAGMLVAVASVVMITI